MRTVLVVACLISSVPAYADFMEDQAVARKQWLQEQQDKSKALRAANVKKETDQKALCARVGGVRVGLNVEGVLKSCWGKPVRINRTTTASHEHEQWVYGGGQYVYLVDGVVTSIQTTR